MKSIIHWIVAGSAVLLAAGCASVPMASETADAQAKAFTVSADKANLYIYRNESMGAAVKMPVLIDGQTVGDTAAKTYIFRQVTPGKHLVTSKTENDSNLEVHAIAGKNHYVWQEVKMGVMSARSKLHEVDEATGRAGVMESKLIAAP